MACLYCHRDDCPCHGRLGLEDSLRSIAEDAQTEVSRLREEVEELRRTERAYAVLLQRRESAERRASRLEARLARVLRFAGRPTGIYPQAQRDGVWSRKHAGGRK